MKLIYFIARRSRATLLWAVISGILSGICASGLLGVINLALNENQGLSTKLITGFVLLAAAVPIARITSEILLTRLGQNALLNLRMEMSGLILSQPLRRMEELGLTPHPGSPARGSSEHHRPFVRNPAVLYKFRSGPRMPGLYELVVAEAFRHHVSVHAGRNHNLSAAVKNGGRKIQSGAGRIRQSSKTI